MGSKKDSPDIDIPDPSQTIRELAQGSRVNTFSPFGSLQYSGANRDTARLQLTPQLQSLVDNIISTAQDDYSPDNIIAGLQDRIGGDFDLRARRLQDDLTQSGNPAVGADLAPGAVSELDLLERARTGAMLDAEIAGNQIGFNRAILPLNQLSQIGGLVTGTSAGLAQPIDPTGAYQLTQNAQLGAAGLANQQQQGKNSLFGDLGSAAALVFSDRRLKRDIHALAATLAGLTLYLYRYVWGGAWYVGVMAHEAALTRPDAVAYHPSGYLMVDYRRLADAKP